MSSVNLKDLILKELSQAGELTSEELLAKLDSKGAIKNPIEARKALADLVREGLVIKVPAPERMKFVFKRT
jgi:hypothetical protein